MNSFKTDFTYKERPLAVTVTPVEQDQYSIVVDATGEENVADPTLETLVPRKQPALIVLRSHTGNWMILEQGEFDLTADELASLGKAIDTHTGNRSQT